MAAVTWATFARVTQGEGHRALLPVPFCEDIPMFRLFVAALTTAGFLMTATGSATEQSTDPIRYTLRFPAPHTHYMEVEAVYPTEGRPQIELFMASAGAPFAV